MRSRRTFAIAGGLLLAGYAVFLEHHTVFAVGGSDSSGYANAARLLAAGRVSEPIPGLRELGLGPDYASAFIPMGYVPAARAGEMAPSYPPGLPLHIAFAASVGGWDRAPFYVNPVAAVACLVMLYLLGRELRLPPVLALAGPALLAASPTFVYMAVQPMSDALATAWAVAAVLAGYRARRIHPLLWSAIAGAAFAIGVLVRPMNVLMLAPLAFALPARPRAWLSFAAAGAPFALFLLAYNRNAFGDPLTSGYGALLEGALAWANFTPRAAFYASTLARLATPLLLLGWLVLAADRRAPARDRAVLLSWFGAFFLFYSFYGPYDAWWYTRFLLPGLPAMILGALIVARDLLYARDRPRPSRTAVAGVALALAAVVAAGLRFMDREQVHKIYKGEAIYPETCAMAARRVPANGIVLSMQMSGALHYYTDLTFAMWTGLDPTRFALLRTSTESRGRRWYALLWPFETEEARRNCPGEWREIARARDVVLWELPPLERDQTAAAPSASLRVPMKMRKSSSIPPLSVSRRSASQRRVSSVSSQGSPARKLLTIPNRSGFNNPPP